jgi:peroxiredoxin
MSLFRSTLLLTLFSLLLLPVPSRALDVGKAPPDFKLKTLDGKEVRLSDYKGQVIVLKLATTWCPTCQQQTGEFIEAGKFLKENNVQVLEVFLQDTPDMVKAFLKEKAEEAPILPLLDDGQVHKSFNVYLIPRVLVIGPDFIVRRDGSLITAYDLKKQIEPLLAQGKP